MPTNARSQFDLLIIGGGVVGLWTLDVACRAGLHAVLVERAGLASEQTGWSQGIIHGGVKYTLSGVLTPAAEAIREMPRVWRECLAGRALPDLSGVPLRSSCTYLWRTNTWRSRAGMFGAKFGLRAAPMLVSPEDRPPALRGCPGEVARLDEPVVDVFALCERLARPYPGRVLRGEVTELRRAGEGVEARLASQAGASTQLAARWVMLAAGRGNESLRTGLGLPAGAMQIRPLHMTLVKGSLPDLYGHCVDGARTRVTITSASIGPGERLWQVGGQVAEEGVALDGPRLIERVRSELIECIPGVSLHGCAWATYRADRAEGATRAALRPNDAQVLREGPILTVWPTKLALAPRAAALVLSELKGEAAHVADPGSGGEGLPPVPDEIAGWPRAAPAAAVWDSVEWAER